jgi:hypothetical protein
MVSALAAPLASERDKSAPAKKLYIFIILPANIVAQSRFIFGNRLRQSVLLLRASVFN